MVLKAKLRERYEFSFPGKQQTKSNCTCEGIIITGTTLPAATTGEATQRKIVGAEGLLGESGSEQQITDTNRATAIKKDIQLCLRGSSLKSRPPQSQTSRKGEAVQGPGQQAGTWLCHPGGVRVWG